MDKIEFISSGLLELYATGIASSEERKMVEDYLSQYPELKEELNKIEISLENYAMSQSETPSASVKSNLLSSLDFKKEVTHNNKKEIPVIEIQNQDNIYESKKVSKFNFSYLAAASVILLIGSIIFAYTFYNKYQDASANLAAAQEKLSKQQQSNEALSSDINVMTNKNVLPVVMNGTPKMPGALAKLFWMKTTGDVYIDPSNLPETPVDKQYQLWAIVDGKPVDAGMISKEKGEYRIQKMKSFGNVEAFAITMEKTGGSATPTMDEMVVSVKM